MIETLITLLILIVVLGAVIYLLDLLPIDDRFKQIAKVLVIVVAVILLLLQLVPLVGGFGDID